MTGQDMLSADVIVVGGGITGMVLSALLAEDGFQVILVEGREPRQLTSAVKADPRALALTLASRKILQQVGAWPQIPTDKIGRFSKMHVWDENGHGEIRFDSAELCQQALGYIVETCVLEQALTTTLSTSKRIEWYQPAKPVEFQVLPDHAVLGLSDGRRLSAKLIVAADGARSSVRDLAGIGIAIEQYDQQALACVVNTQLPHENTARQRFLTDGPLAFLPMADPHQCGIVWSTSPEHAGQLQSMQVDEFRSQLAERFGYTLGKITDCGERVVFPLRKAQAEQYCLQRVALIGDAAHSVHPLAGQGANLGLLDAAALAEVLCDAQHKGRDFGSRNVLRKYERWRRGENQIMIQVMDGFKLLFTNQTPPLVEMRNLGLNLTNKIAPVKHWIMQRAMGLSGDLPKVARA